jgi:hypothetical protein
MHTRTGPIQTQENVMPRGVLAPRSAQIETDSARLIAQQIAAETSGRDLTVAIA